MPQPNFTLLAGSSHASLAQEVAELLKMPLGKAKLTTFSSGEKYVMLEESVRGKDVFLLQTCRDQWVNEDYMELFLMINAAKLSFASKVHVIIPHFGYARQDKIHVPREPISCKLMGDLLVTAGADHVITFDLHSDQAQAFFDVPVDNVKLDKSLAKYFGQKNLKDVTVVSPDAGGAKNAKKFADRLEGASLAILHKARPEHNQAVTTHVVGEVEGRTCIIFDDMIDTAGSVCAARETLLKHGANSQMYLAATHPIFSDPAVQRLSEAGFTEVVVTNTLPLGESKQFKGLKHISIAPLLAEIIESITAQKSVSALYY